MFCDRWPIFVKKISLKILLRISALLFLTPVFIVSCTTTDLYEKTVSIPGHRWKADFIPEFTFNIKDTAAEYQLYFIIRHNEKYNYKNIWIALYYQPPGDTLHKESIELQLATDQKGWLGTGMGDIYEHRIPLLDRVSLKNGNYHFRIEQIMREDPLENVLNVGLRAEKKQ